VSITLATSDLFIQLAPWLGGLVVVAVIGGVIMLAARNYLTNKSSETTSLGFTLADLRGLKERGEIDQTEYERLKSALMNSPEMTGPISSTSAAQSNNKKAKPPV
jgi:hypothetical protein